MYIQTSHDDLGLGLPVETEPPESSAAVAETKGMRDRR